MSDKEKLKLKFPCINFLIFSPESTHHPKNFCEKMFRFAEYTIFFLNPIFLPVLLTRKAKDIIIQEPVLECCKQNEGKMVIVDILLLVFVLHLQCRRELV